MFRSALQKYEQKKYQESYDELETVLQRDPLSGESLCLKALCQLGLKMDDKGEDLIKKGLELSPKNSIAFHIAGIWYKIEKRYREAYSVYAKSYLLDQENLNVQQDLGMLAMNEHEYKLAVEVRRRFLRSRPQMHVAWTCLGVSQHRAGDLAAAINTLNLYMDLLANERSQRKYLPPVKANAEKIEVSETLLYVNDLMAESGDLEGALKHLTDNELQIWDKLAWFTKRAQHLTGLGSPEAPKAWLDLIHRNPDCAQYYEQLEDLMAWSIDQKMSFYAKMRVAYPKAEFPKQRPLFLLEGAQLEQYLLEYINAKIARGVPSLYVMLKPLYKSGVMATIASKITAPTSEAELAAYNLFMAKHTSKLGDHEQALKYAEAAGDVAEARLAYARILTRLGDFKGAAQVAKDLADKEKGDRFLNTKAVKYALLAGEFELANSLAADFPTRSKESADGLKYMVEFEAVDYLARCASAYSLYSDHMMALKRAENTLDVFENAYDHQYDFHYFACRKGALRTYEQLIDWVDSLYTHPRYEEAARVAIDEYVQYAVGAPDGISPSQKEALIKERTAAQDSTKEDTDPWGVTYSSPSDPLEAALKAWKPLSQARPTNARTWQLVLPVYLAQKKYVLAVQALKKAKEFGASDSWVAFAGLHASHVLANDEAAPAAIRSLQLKMLGAICPGDLSQPLAQYADAHILDQQLWLEARLLIGAAEGVEEKLAAELAKVDSVTARKWYLYLRRHGAGQAFGQAVKTQFPRATFVF